jgi:hypothetical protein
MAANPEPESPSAGDRLMEAVCERENLKQALKRVKANKGAPGVDGMMVQALSAYLREHWPAMRASLLNGTYRPQPVRRGEIPKPDGGVRKLGIPSALDRFVQQAVLQVLQRQWDPTFSDASYGFRPGRIASERPDDEDRAYMHSIMCQVGLPRSKVDGTSFERQSGGAALLLEAGKLWGGHRFVQQPIPYGPMPRSDESAPLNR